MLLLSLGIAVIYSSSESLAIGQAIFACIGLVFYFFLRSWDYRFLKNFIKPFYILIVTLLLITFFLGFETRGSIRWIPLGLFNLQPSEFAKLLFIVLLADFWSKNLPTWKNIFKSFLIISPILFLVFKQPDLGTTLTLGFAWFGILIASQISISKLMLVIFSGLSVIPVIWFNLQSYQKQRIFSFISPQQDPQGIGFHVIQSTIAVGSGQFFGRGLGRGTQSRLQFLPEFRTDFIFAFIAEELGFIGSIIVLVLYLLIFVFAHIILSGVKDRFGELIVIGVFSTLFFQIFVNIGMNIGLLPITGITLPLLSYGGSSLVTTMMMLGLVASVAKFGVKKRTVESFGIDTI